ncbi:hypothetical protein ACVXG7_13240 [Enterobacter hormaechei]
MGMGDIRFTGEYALTSDDVAEKYYNFSFSQTSATILPLDMSHFRLT